jgi:hypothetical protein
LSREEAWMKYCGDVLAGWYIHGRRTWPSRYMVHVTGNEATYGIRLLGDCRRQQTV